MSRIENQTRFNDIKIDISSVKPHQQRVSQAEEKHNEQHSAMPTHVQSNQEYYQQYYTIALPYVLGPCANLVGFFCGISSKD